jgi:hypothetical protein
MPKLNLADTQLGVKFRVVEFTDADIQEFAADPVKLTRITDAVNADRRQKVALVDARYDLSVAVAALGFARLSKSVTKDGETTEVPTETENTHIGRFVTEIAAGNFNVDGFTAPAGDPAVRETAAIAFLQTLAYKQGDKTYEDQPAYVLTLDKTVRKGGTGLIPKWAMEAAATIITNKNQQAWVDKFTTGYTTNRGIWIDPIVFESFVEKAHKQATPEEREAVHALNVKHLAKAITEVRKQENEKLQPEFA